MLLTTAHGYRRLLIVVEYNAHHLRDISHYLDIKKLADETGVKVVFADPLIKSGKGMAFAKVKAEFDMISDPMPMALIATAKESAFMVGADFGNADCVITLGGVALKYLTQFLGRVFRPSMTRDNTKQMLMIKLYT
jgi:hypothetical protein